MSSDLPSGPNSQTVKELMRGLASDMKATRESARQTEVQVARMEEKMIFLDQRMTRIETSSAIPVYQPAVVPPIPVPATEAAAVEEMAAKTAMWKKATYLLGILAIIALAAAAKFGLNIHI